MGNFPLYPVRLKLSRFRGFNLQRVSHMANGNCAIKVDRSTRWGNPFRVTGPDDLRRAVVAHRHWMTMDTPQAYLRRGAAVVALRGRNLACWCPLPKPGHPDVCHAATLVQVANAGWEAHPIALLAFLGALGGAAAGCGAVDCPIKEGPFKRKCECVAACYADAAGAERWQGSWPHSASNPRVQLGVLCDCRWCLDNEAEGT